MLYVFLVYLAIKKTPILKKTFCIIGLLPMGLSLAVAISYDSVLIAMSILCTALIFRLIFDDNVKKINYKYLMFFGIAGFILLTIKTVYITVLLPLLFVPKEKFGEKRINIVKKFGIIAGIAIIAYILNKLPSLGLQRNAVTDNSGEQLNYILANPGRYIMTWLKTMWSNRNFYYTGMIGTFGLIDTYIPTVYIVMYSVFGFAVILSDVSMADVKINWKYRLIAILGCIATTFGIFTGLYILWTSMELGVGSEIITGVQGRYFIPILPLGVVILFNSVLRKNTVIKSFMQKLLNNCYIVPSVMLAVSFITIFLRYWC
jgi:uncharacterized membrane protein